MGGNSRCCTCQQTWDASCAVWAPLTELVLTFCHPYLPYTHADGCALRCAGTNFLTRSTAFQQAGWSPEFTLTEDFALGMELKKHKWHCRWASGCGPAEPNCTGSRRCAVVPADGPPLLSRVLASSAAYIHTLPMRLQQLGCGTVLPVPCGFASQVISTTSGILLLSWHLQLGNATAHGVACTAGHTLPVWKWGRATQMCRRVSAQALCHLLHTCNALYLVSCSSSAAFVPKTGPSASRDALLVVAFPIAASHRTTSIHVSIRSMCRYVEEYLAIGEAPEQVRNCFQQRSRWCKVRSSRPTGV